MWTIAQRAAYIQSQAACMLAEIAGMEAENKLRELNWETPSYGEEHFTALIEKYGLGCNTVTAFLQEVQS